MGERVVHAVDVGSATLSLRRAGCITPDGVKEEAAGAGEFSVLNDCVCRDGIIRPRRRLVRVTSLVPAYPSILSMGEFRSGASGETWLVMALRDTQAVDVNAVFPVAAILSRDENVMRVRARKQGSSAAPPNVPLAFWDYRNQLWATNGLFAQVFDGRTWGDLNDGETEIAGRLGGVAEGKMFLLNTPCYADEILWADKLVELPVNTKWTGVAAGGGTGVGVPLWAICAPDASYGLFAAGGAGTIIRSLSEGASWFGLPAPTVATFRGMALLFHDSDLLDGWLVGPSYLSGETRKQNVWHMAFTGPDVNPTFTSEMVGGIIELNAVVIDPEHSGDTDPWKYAIVGGATSSSEAEIRQWDTGWGGGIYNVHTGAEVRDICVVYDGSAYHHYACGSHDSSGNALMVRKGGAVAELWYDADGGEDHMAEFPDLSEQSVNLDGLAGFGTGGAHTLFVAGNKGSEGKFYRYDGAGATPVGEWTEGLWPVAYQNYSPKHVIALSRLIAIVVGERGLVLKTTDGGVNWTAQVSGVAVQLNRIIRWDPADDNKLCAVGDGGVFIRTDDGGATWVTVGTGEDNPNRMINALRLGAGESIRAKYQRSGMLYVFTSRGIRALDEATMKVQFQLDGFETFNDNCIGEYRGMIVILGRLNGTPGIYGWDGSASPPRLLSESVTGLFRSSPSNDYMPCLRAIPDTSDHVYDTEDDFRPRVTGDPGWAFKTDHWDYRNGLMVMRILPAATATRILSHGVSGAQDDAPFEVDTHGIHVPNVTDWGIIAFDYTLNHPAADDDDHVAIRLEVRTATENEWQPELPGTWDDDWVRVGYLPHTGQGAMLGRCTMRLDPADVPATNTWLQFQLVCVNAATSDFNLVINRVAVRAYLDTDPETCPAPPCLVVHDDSIQAHFSVDVTNGQYQPRCVVLSGERLQASAMLTENEVACARVLDEELLLGQFYHSGDVLPSLLFSPEDGWWRAAEHIGVGQELRFFADFATDARARTRPKDLLRLHISARPADYNGSVTLTVQWAADDIGNLSDGTELVFSRQHKPESGLLRHHTLEVASADVDGDSSGRRFHFCVTGDRPFVLEALAIEAEVREGEWATAYQG